MRHMVRIAEEELKRVSTGGKRDRCFRLSRSEMQMIEVVRDRLVQRRQLGVDQKVVVAGVSPVDPRRCYPHIDKAKANGRILRKNRAILQPHETELGVTRRCRTDSRNANLDAR